MKRLIIFGILFFFFGLGYAQKSNATESSVSFKNDMISTPSLFKTYVITGILLAGVTVVLIMMRRRQWGMAGKSSQNDTIKIIARQRITPKTEIIRVEIEGKTTTIVESLSHVKVISHD